MAALKGARQSEHVVFPHNPPFQNWSAAARLGLVG